ncbi:hypothetical protein Fmac_027656 [Flemingia macrophylla]|uniref:DUF7804 domain-containing protein n=1 Tax=Flemingia macrophylla TaxID=520843 RepID=A0ABD1LIB7_9FABA
MRESMVDIVRSLREVPLLVQVYAGNTSRSMEKKVMVDWEVVKEKWESEESPLPEGVIFIEELGRDAAVEDVKLLSKMNITSHRNERDFGGESEIYEIDYRGPETHSSVIPPPHHFHIGKPNKPRSGSLRGTKTLALRDTTNKASILCFFNFFLYYTQF